LAGYLAQGAHAKVLLIDYRLGPEHPFPAAVEDAAAAYHFLLQQGVAPSNITIAGDSAGGGLALAVLVLLRDAAEPLPATAVCLSPWVDLAGTGLSMETNREVDLMLSPELLARYASLYLNGREASEPLASPIYADLTGLPPTLIQVGSEEILLDDASRLAEKAQAAGVSVTLEVWPKMFHVWPALAMIIPEGGQAIARIAEFIENGR
jgi:acetyl esterase/lipase